MVSFKHLLIIHKKLQVVTIPQNKTRDDVDSLVVKEVMHRQLNFVRATSSQNEIHADEDMQMHVENNFDKFNAEFSDVEPEPEPIRKRTRNQSRNQDNLPEAPPPFETEDKQKKVRRGAKKIQNEAHKRLSRRIIKVEPIEINTDDE